MKKTLLTLALVTLSLAGAQAEDVFMTWISPTSSSWGTLPNWTPAILPNAYAEGVIFDTIATDVTIGMTNTVIKLGSIEVKAAYPAALALSSSSSSGAIHTLTLGGQTLGGVDNVIVSMSSSYDFTFKKTNKTTDPDLLAIALGNATDNKFLINGSGNIIADVDVSSENPMTIAGAGTGKFVLGANGTLSSNSTLAIGAGATFDVKAQTAFTLAAVNGLTLDVGAANAGKLDATGIELTYAKPLTLNITSATPLASYNLFTLGSAAGTFDSVTLAGSFTESMVGVGGVWTATTDGRDFTFTESTGVLSITVPEPSTCALVALGSIAFLWTLRRKPRVA
jgi:hypothetical protein